ncbi:MFS transporter [Sulfobacillus harzensis]|uniref:MFS transporter n=1 Tax=Sulfobacillus harzensis TaxID=2729629 RepID=A0A7Y0Q610_9FIRM|nr:MFS transporter [Sulfobacillus harzensis]NMP24874.1 MFS transporter [Sulfobacillus harzensis]
MGLDRQVHRDFQLLWVGQGLAALGTQIPALALPLTAILRLHASAGAVGVLNALQWLPFLVLSLFVGMAVDRHRRRPLLIVADGGRALVLGGIVALAVSGRLSLPILWALVFLFGVGTVVFELAFQAYVPGLVGTDGLMRANTRLQATTTGAQLGGPALAGALVQTVTAPVALGLTAVSLLISVVTLSAMRTEGFTPTATVERPWTQFLQGAQLIWTNPYLRSLVPVSACYNLFNEWMLTVYLLYAVRHLHLSPILLGVTLAGGTGGAFLGALLADKAVRRFGLGATFLGVVMLESLAAPLVPLAPSGTGWTVPLLVMTFGAMDFGVTLSSVVAISVRQTVTPAPLLGRMTAGYRMISYGTIPLGAAAGGWVSQALGLHTGLLIGALALMTTIVWALWSPVVRLQSIADLVPTTVNEPDGQDILPD